MPFLRRGRWTCLGRVGIQGRRVRMRRKAIIGIDGSGQHADPARPGDSGGFTLRTWQREHAVVHGRRRKGAGALVRLEVWRTGLGFPGMSVAGCSHGGHEGSDSGCRLLQEVLVLSHARHVRLASPAVPGSNGVLWIVTDGAADAVEKRGATCNLRDMSGLVAVVTDSTAYLPEVEAARLGITVIPLQVIVGDKVFDDGTEIDFAHLRAALTQGKTMTSRPAPERFIAAYRALAEKGATAVVSVHVSGEMSGTVDSARLGARDAPIPVEVIDSRSIAMGMGFAVLTAAEEAARGASVDEVAAAARHRIETTRSFFYVDTLEYLRRGGRIGAAASLLGSALMIKPLLHIKDGGIVPLEKVRTASRALARLEDLAVEAAGTGRVDIAVQHLAARPNADALAERLTRRVPALGRMEIVEVGAAIAVHVGPGMLGVTVSPS